MAVKIWLHERPASLGEFERWVPAADEKEGYGSLEKVRAEAGRWQGTEPNESWDNAGWVVSYEGLTVRLREQNMWDDSDFYALVWDPTKGERHSVLYGTTRCWTYNSSATVDASDEAREAYEAQETAARMALAAEIEAEEAARLAALPSRGKTVKVVKGRKVPKGTTGEVFWYGQGHYGWRVGFKDADGEAHWTDASNVEVVAATEEVAA